MSFCWLAAATAGALIGWNDITTHGFRVLLTHTPQPRLFLIRNKIPAVFRRAFALGMRAVLVVMAMRFAMSWILGWWVAIPTEYVGRVWLPCCYSSLSLSLVLCLCLSLLRGTACVGWVPRARIAHGGDVVIRACRIPLSALPTLSSFVAASVCAVLAALIQALSIAVLRSFHESSHLLSAPYALVGVETWTNLTAAIQATDPFVKAHPLPLSPFLLVVSCCCCGCVTGSVPAGVVCNLVSPWRKHVLIPILFAYLYPSACLPVCV